MVAVNTAIVGTQKGGTSTLFDLLRQHPEVCWGPRKEWHYFDDESKDWEAPDHSAYAARVRQHGQRLAVDGTPAYLFWPGALTRMHAYLPSMRLVASFRDPIERAFSHWAMYYGRLESFPTFTQLAQGPPRRALLDRMPRGWSPVRMRRASMVPRGLYGEQLRRGLELFPRDQWLFVDFHRFAQDHRTTLEQLTEFLGLAPYPQEPSLEIIQATRTDLAAPPPTAADVERLAEIYAADLDLFAQLSGLDLADWSTRRVIDGRLAPGDLADQLARKAGLR